MNIRNRISLAPSAHTCRRGVSYIEIVITVIIISILTLIMVPVVNNRSRQARVTAAEQDLETLADAMERVSIDTDYYVRLYVLDDRPGVGDGIANDDPANIVDGTRDLDIGSSIHSSPTLIFIDPVTQDFATNNAALFSRFIENETSFNFRGPYVNFSRDVNGNDWPDDPWGNDYLLLTTLGVLVPNNRFDPPTGQDDRFNTVAPSGANARIFDRPTILSKGPDGIFGTIDDIAHQFGG